MYIDFGCGYDLKQYIEVSGSQKVRLSAVIAKL